MQFATIPTGYNRIKRVRNFQELSATPFVDGINALCWERPLAGNFAEVARAIVSREGVVALDEAHLKSLALTAAGLCALQVMLEDLRLLRELGRDPVLNCIHGYPRDEEPGPVPTDVFSFHADSAPVEADTWLCTYHGRTSEGLRNDEARRKADVPEIRAELLKRFGGEDNEDFRAWLTENCFDLHYAPVHGAQPFSFGLFNLWRIAIDWPGNPVPPCIHRAPETVSFDPPRLLLIS